MKKVFTIAAAALLSICLCAQEHTVFLMGDSTMAPKDLSKGSPERGWGMYFGNFLDSSFTTENWARNGRSTKSFIDEGLWDMVRSRIKPGDYLLIEFGHNDEKSNKESVYAPAWGAYQENLRLFARTALEKGAHPVLIGPIARRLFVDGEFTDKPEAGFNATHGEYPAAMKAVAEELGIPYLDLTTDSVEWLKKLGDEGSKPYFMHLKPYEFACAPEGKEDNTHLRVGGARAISELACKRIRESVPGLARHLIDVDIVVAQDGTGDFATVQEAINAAPDYEHARITRIHIKEGTYREMVSIPHNKFRLHISGDGADKTIITYDKCAEQHWDRSGTRIGTSGSATLYCHSSYVTFEDLTIANSSGEGKGVGQAVALFTDGDFLFFNRCRLIGNQDTLYTYGRFGKSGGIQRNYFLDCYIEGTTDFIFGPSIAYFERCELRSKKNSYVTAASTLEGQKYGYVFHKCTLTAEPGVTKCYLGRPWGAFAKTVFIECELGQHILAEGWHDWEKEGKPDTRKNSYYAEYGNSGPGAVKDGRVKWSHQLTKKEASEYSFEKVMYQEQDGIVWNPFDNR